MSIFFLSFFSSRNENIDFLPSFLDLMGLVVDFDDPSWLRYGNLISWTIKNAVLIEITLKISIMERKFF